MKELIINFPGCQVRSDPIRSAIDLRAWRGFQTADLFSTGENAMTLTRLRNQIVTMLCLLALGSFFSSSLLAGTTVPPAPGTIYFYSSAVGRMSMNGDGTGKKVVPVVTPSYQLHANSRWSLQGDYDYNGTRDPNGNLPWELFATNARGQYFQLTNDPNVSWIWDVPPTWAKDDSFVSFTGVRKTSTGVIGGLFVIHIDWSLDFPVPGPPTLAIAADAVAPLWWSWAEVNFYEHDWSPTGGSVVYKSKNANGIAQLNTAIFSNVGVALRYLTNGASPSWSFDGSRIAFDRGEVWTIKPDGSDPIQVTQTTLTSLEQRRQINPVWSPDGKFLAFTDIVTKLKTSTSIRSVQRVLAGGGIKVNLTSDVANSSSPHWRF